MSGAKQKEMFEISDLRRSEVCLSGISSNISLLIAYEWAFVIVGFCPSGLLSFWAFVQWAFVLVGFCPSGLLSYTPFSQVRSAKKHGERILICPSLTLCIDFFHSVNNQ